jgi:mono/diheme cytochrome c family protein
MMKLKLSSSLILAAVTVVATGCAREEAVSFSTQVKPILDENCLACHSPGGEGLEASGFSMETYEDLMKGTRYGAMVVPGDTLGSNLLVLMEGRADPSISMPHGSGDPVSESDIDAIRAWISQGAENN